MDIIIIRLGYGPATNSTTLSSHNRHFYALSWPSPPSLTVTSQRSCCLSPFTGVPRLNPAVPTSKLLYIYHPTMTIGRGQGPGVGVGVGSQDNAVATGKYGKRGKEVVWWVHQEEKGDLFKKKLRVSDVYITNQTTFLQNCLQVGIISWPSGFILLSML